MKTKNLLLGLALSTLTLQSCNVLDIDPTDTYSESTAYASIKNLDLYVKSFYNVFYSNADINVGANLAMDDGVSDLIKYSWFNVAEGSVNKLFYYDNMMIIIALIGMTCTSRFAGLMSIFTMFIVALLIIWIPIS